jgi:Diacylglycerol kinase
VIKLLRKAPARFAASFGYCRDAVLAMFRKEESFRLEMIALVLLVAVMLVCGWPWWKRVALVGCYLLVPLTEVLNSAVEDVCDLITRERNELVKNAKDKGALAVLLAIVFNCFTLATLLLIDD